MSLDRPREQFHTREGNHQPEQSTSQRLFEDILYGMDRVVANSLGSEPAFQRPQSAETKVAEAPKSYLPSATLTDGYFDFSQKAA
jgi:hypothetical protein